MKIKKVLPGLSALCMLLIGSVQHAEGNASYLTGDCNIENKADTPNLRVSQALVWNAGRVERSDTMYGPLDSAVANKWVGPLDLVDFGPNPGGDGNFWLRLHGYYMGNGYHTPGFCAPNPNRFYVRLTVAVDNPEDVLELGDLAFTLAWGNYYKGMHEVAWLYSIHYDAGNGIEQLYPATPGDYVSVTADPEDETGFCPMPRQTVDVSSLSGTKEVTFYIALGKDSTVMSRQLCIGDIWLDAQSAPEE